MKITKKLEPFPVLFEEAEGIRRANITIRTNNQTGSAQTEDDILGAGIRKLKTGVVAPQN